MGTHRHHHARYFTTREAPIRRLRHFRTTFFGNGPGRALRCLVKGGRPGVSRWRSNDSRVLCRALRQRSRALARPVRGGC